MQKIALIAMAVTWLLAACGSPDDVSLSGVESYPEQTETVSIEEPESTVTEEATVESTEQTESVEESTTTEESVETFTDHIVVDMAEVRADVEAAFTSALDYIVPEEYLDASSMVSNAIIRKTTVQILAVEERACQVTVRYPDAATALKTAENALAADATGEQMDEMLQILAADIEAEKVEMLEQTFEVQLTEYEGVWNIVWTKELYDAFTGGLYSAE